MERKVNYTKEFKVQACELVVKNGLKVKAVADKMGINHIMLCLYYNSERLHSGIGYKTPNSVWM